MKPLPPPPKPRSQVLLPSNGARIIVCSDGVWDLMSLSKAVKLCRFKPASAATAALMGAVSRDLRLLVRISISSIATSPLRVPLRGAGTP